MIVLITLIPIALLGYLLWRADKRLDLAMKEWSLERTALLQRIQAPEKAVIEDFEPSSLHQYAHYGLDEDVNDAIAEQHG